ncbi:hypothetical protein ACFYTQ_03930 [Nocardia sp. NPDC004068]|uniref:hypothetical protein n=1 Tax=Nocardia sp. NPDC004068 TaxID=3364303 RepID=UPI0036B39A55
MRTVDGTDSGVIGAAPYAPAPEAAHVVTEAAGQSGPILDVALPQLPADMPPIEPPAFTLARKEFDDDGTVLGVPHAPGLGGGSPDPAAAIHPAALADPSSPLLGAAHTALNDAQGVLNSSHTAAQGVLDSAQTALGHAGGGGMAAAVQQAGTPAAAAAAAAPTVAPMPSDPIGALMNGAALPALPGVDALFKPFLDLLSSFGTGVLGALNPAALLNQSSQIIQTAMQVGMGAVKSVEQVWEGQAARGAQTAAAQTQAHGEDASQRGFDISKLTEEAAAVVQRGNVQLTAVANMFAAEATALAPVIFTPPAQATLIASATEHLGTAVGIVNATRAELAGYTGQLSGVVQQLLGTSAPDAAQVAQSVAQNVGEPIMEQAQQLLSGDGIGTQAAGLGGTDLTGSGPGASTHAASFGGNGAHPGSFGGSGGGAGGFGGGLFGGHGGGSGSGGASAAKPGAGAALPGGRGVAGVPGMPFGPGMPGAPGQGAAGSGFLGAPGGVAGQRRDDDEHGRNVQPYQSPTGNTDLTGGLGESAPEVIGQTHSDEIINDYEMDQL